MAGISQHIISIIAKFTGGPQAVSQIEKINTAMKGVGKDVPSVTAKIGDFERALRRAAIVAPVWMLLRGTMMAVTNVIRDQIKFLIELETAMARIKIVGKGTEEEYKSLQGALIGLAYTYGTTASEAAAAAVIFAQQGRNVKETIELTRAAMLASKILGTDIKTAVDDMTAAIEGFQLGVGDATAIVDKWINVEKQFAVTSKDLADATKVAGASANQLGMTMAQFLGDVTAIVEVTRKSGSEAARGLSFIYARLLTSGKETVEQITKIPYYLDATGKATNAVSTEMRSISSILEDLAGKWEGLTTQEKLQIATSLGSKRQMVALYALMQNYNASLDARIAALTSAGASEKAFAIIQDTTAIKLKQVSAAWNVLTSALGDTSAFKASLSYFDKMIINITALIDYEKAYGALYSREINKVQLANETRLSEIKSLEELISVRDKLVKVPQTIENVERFKKVQDAIDAISEKQPRIKVALETGRPEDLKKQIDQITEELSIEKIKLTVSLEYEPKIAEAEKEIRELQQEIRFTSGEDRVTKSKELVVMEEKVKKLYDNQSKSIKEQYKIQTGKLVAEQLITDELEEQNEEIRSGISLTKKQEEEVEDLLLQYEKATPEEKPALRRKVELAQMTEQNQLFAFSTSKEDRAALLEMASKLTDSVKRAMAGMISYEQGIYTQGRFSPFLDEPAKAGLVNNTITNIGAKEVNVNVNLAGGVMPTPEEMVTLMTNEMGKALLSDEEFLNSLGKKLPSKLQGGK
jgi:TP901 family phage tail tape measure protein